MSNRLQLEDKLDNITIALLGISESQGGEGINFKSAKGLQTLVRMGLASKVIDDYDQIGVNRITSMTATAHGSVTSPAVNLVTFETKIGEAETKDYEFAYNGSTWKLNGKTVAIAQYGITYSGTPASGDTIVAHTNASEIIYDVLGIDHDIPVDSNYSHTLTLCEHDCEQYGVLAYKKPQALFYVNPTTYPNGLAAGTYNITLDHGDYNNDTAEDGTYQFTITQAVPAGGAIRHSSIGAYRSSYAKSNVLSGTFTTYGTIANGRQIIEQNLATTEGSSGSNLGTFTAETLSYRSSADCNLTRRCAYGTNSAIDSDERMWMNSDAAAGTKANGDMNWHELVSVFDLPATANIAGYLYGLDPNMRAVMGKVRKRTYKMPADRTASETYLDSEELVFPLSMTEVGLGTNSGVYENAVDANGNVKTTAYPYWARRTTNAERIKYQSGTARNWWLRSPFPSNSNHVRVVGSSGALGNAGDANYTRGAVAAFCIV